MIHEIFCSVAFYPNTHLPFNCFTMGLGLDNMALYICPWLSGLGLDTADLVQSAVLLSHVV